MIREGFSEANMTASARSVYLALCELASDAQCETFTVERALIAFRAGVALRTLDKVIEILQALQLISVTRQNAERNAGSIKAPNTYTLLAMGKECASPPFSETAMRNGCASTMRNERGTSVAHKSKEGWKNQKKDRVARATVCDSSSTRRKSEIPSEEELFEYAEAEGINIEWAEQFLHFNNAKGWQIEDRKTGAWHPMQDWRKALKAFATKLDNDRDGGR